MSLSLFSFPPSLDSPMPGDQFVMFSHKKQSHHVVCKPTDTWDTELISMDFDVSCSLYDRFTSYLICYIYLFIFIDICKIVAVAAIKNGFAAIGLVDMFNAGGAVVRVSGIYSSLFPPSLLFPLFCFSPLSCTLSYCPHRSLLTTTNLPLFSQ